MSHSVDVADGNGAAKANDKKRLFRRGPWENASTVIIGAGILMLMQPFALALYTWAFAVIIVGTVGFIITSHFPE